MYIYIYIYIVYLLIYIIWEPCPAPPRQVYNAGSRCLQGLLGIPPVICSSADSLSELGGERERGTEIHYMLCIYIYIYIHMYVSTPQRRDFWT